jgi:membrane-associated protein
MIEWIGDLLHQIYDVEGIIRWGGLLMLVAIVFAETGLMIGFFLPGDSLLVTAGIFAAAGHLDIVSLLLWVTLAAIVGDQLGYYIGHRTGPRIFRREDSLLFKRKHLVRAHEFYEKYGGKTIVIARFVPIVRTFAPTVAGAAEMTYRKFATYNILGGFLWVWSMVLAGYKLPAAISLVIGREFTPDDVKDYLHIIIVVVVFLSILPAIVEWWRERRKARLEPQVTAE